MSVMVESHLDNGLNGSYCQSPSNVNFMREWSIQ